MNKAANFTFIWTIENCHKILIPGTIHSPYFIAESMENSIWHLSLFSIDEQLFSFSIHRNEDHGPECIKVEYELSLVTPDGLSLPKGKHKFNFAKESLCVTQPIATADIFVYRRLEFVVGNTITVRFRMWSVRLFEFEPNLCYASSRLAIEKRTFFWRIRDFSEFKKGQELSYPIESAVNGDVPLTMVLSLSDKESETIRITFPEGKDGRLIIFNFRISMINSKGKMSYTRTGEGNFNTYDLYVDFLVKDRLLRDKAFWLPDDILTFKCEFEIGTGTTSSRIESYRYSPHVQNMYWLSDVREPIHMYNTLQMQ